MAGAWSAEIHREVVPLLEAQIEFENRLVSDLLLYAPDMREEYTSLRDAAAEAQSMAGLRSLLRDGPATVDDAIHAMRRAESLYAGGDGHVSDTTGRGAANLVTLDGATIVWSRGRSMKVRDMAEWLHLIADIERALPWKMQIYLQLRQEHRTQVRGWVAPVQLKYAEIVAARDGVGEWIEAPRTFWVWWKSLVDITAREAAKKGLLRNRVRMTG
jgi:hypothetical protein